MSHGWIQLAPFSHDDAFTQVHRVQRLGDGTVVHLLFTDGGENSIHVETSPDVTPAQEHEIEQVSHKVFNLDLDLREFYELLEGEERYAWVKQAGAGRLMRAPTVWEDLAKTLMTTNTTWSMTRSMVKRISELGESDGSGSHAFPTPNRIASLEFDELSRHVRAGYRNAYLHELANNIAGGLDVESWRENGLSADEMFKLVRTQKGFGPYAAGALLKLLGKFDQLAIDSAARTMFAQEFGGGERMPDSMIRDHYERYGIWKGLVIWMDLMKDWYIRHAGGR